MLHIQLIVIQLDAYSIISHDTYNNLPFQFSVLTIPSGFCWPDLVHQVAGVHCQDNLGHEKKKTALLSIESWLLVV